jgi:hypothetical protein
MNNREICSLLIDSTQTLLTHLRKDLRVILYDNDFTSVIDVHFYESVCLINCMFHHLPVFHLLSQSNEFNQI